MKAHSPKTLIRLLITTIAAISVFSIAVPAQAGSSDENAVTWRVNHEHYVRHIHSLSSSTSLSNLARSHSCEMARSGNLYHTSNLGSKVRGWRILGENVAVGPDLYSIHKAWMNSPAHRDNILETRYRQIGSGVCRDSGGTYWATTVFFG